MKATARHIADGPAWGLVRLDVTLPDGTTGHVNLGHEAAHDLAADLDAAADAAELQRLRVESRERRAAASQLLDEQRQQEAGHAAS